MELNDFTPQLGQSILLSCPVCFLIHEHGNVIYSTPFVRSLLGIKENDSLSDYIVEHDRSDPTKDIGEYQNWSSVDVKTAFGDVKHMEIKTYEVHHDGRNVMLTWIQDVGRLERAENTLKVVRKEMREQARISGDNTAKASYELRKGLSSIMGLADLLGECGQGETQKEYLGQLKKSVQELLVSMDAIINPENGKKAEKELFSIRNILNRVEKAIRIRLDKRSLDYKLLCQDDIPEHLLGYPKHIQDVIVNLAKNAIGFTREGSISVYATEHDRDEESVTLLFSVRDTGSGMPPEQVEALFPQFAVESDESVRRFKNGGLGLTTAMTLVDFMEGRMWCESELGSGTTVYFTARCELPKEGSGPETEIEPVSAGRNPSGVKILIVDDNKVNQTVAAELLKIKGYSVKVADSGVEAVDILKETGDFDLILMDVYMPDMDGPTATKIIREMNPVIPIVALTACAMPGDKEMCLELGMNDYFTKPFEVRDFLNLVSRWTSR